MKEKYIKDFDNPPLKPTTIHFYDEIRRDENGKIVAYVCKRWPKDKKK